MKFVKNQIPRPTLKPITIGKSHLGGSHPVLIPINVSKPIEDSKFFRVRVPRTPPPRKRNKKSKK
ncbi:MAG TPA: hypothetical protein DEG69_22810 [Flavobacteriaceae bacterium]|mgnify:CR=1 FL=1|nr:hypothetical protein [Flavobacteriaceae bacterium]|tara:strand:+ start:390 stop:584 length:195 start_codon:yes stop_codon:yes gene_type:complete